MATDPKTRSLLAFLDRLDDEAKQKREATTEAKRYESFLRIYRGKQTTPANNPFFQANLVGVEIDRKAATLAENKPEMRVTPRRDGIKDTAEILERVIKADWDEQNFSGTLENGALHMGIFGTMIVGIQWDRSARYGLGGLQVYLIDPRNFRMDPAIVEADRLDDAQYIIVDSLQPLSKIRREYPGKGSTVPEDPRSSLFPSDTGAKSVTSRAMNLLRNALSPGDRTGGAIPRGYIREYWIADPTLDDSGNVVFPYGRQVIRGGNETILTDGPNPYFDGTWPFSMCNGKLDPDHPWGRSEAEGLRRLQESVNRIGHLFVDGTIRSGNPRVIMDSDALSADEKNKLSNVGAIMINKRFGRDVRWDPPTPMPPHMLDFIRFTMQLFDVLTGMNDGSQMSGRTELRSGAMLEGLQTQAQVLVRQQARRVESFLERLGQKWISRIFQFYTDDRLLSWMEGQQFIKFAYERKSLVQELAIEAAKAVAQRREKEAAAQQMMGLPYAEPTGDAADRELRQQIEETLRAAWRDFRFKIVPGSSLSGTKMQRAMVFGELAKNGLASPLRVLRELGVEDPEEEMSEAMQYMQARQDAGIPPPDQKPGRGKTSPQ